MGDRKFSNSKGHSRSLLVPFDKPHMITPHMISFLITLVFRSSYVSVLYGTKQRHSYFGRLR